jgi:uncharacterized protein with GYD domain
MTHYIILWTFTDQGIKNVKDTIKRAGYFKNAVENAGGKLISEYYTFGKLAIQRQIRRNFFPLGFW